MLTQPPRAPIATTAPTEPDVSDRLRSLRLGLAELNARRSVAELLALAARSASQACGLQRVCLWRVDGDELVPVSVFDEEHPHLGRDFIHLVSVVRPRLALAPIEEEVVRTREPAIVANALRDARVFRPLVGIVGTLGYVVAAVPDGDGAFGILTADHGGGAGRPVDTIDLELLSSFGAGLGRLLADRQVLGENTESAAVADMLADGEVPLLQRLRDGLSVLHDAGGPEQVAARAVAALCQSVGFDRAALFTAESGIVRALAVHTGGPPEEAARFAEQVRAAAVRFDSSLVEFDVMRERQPLLVRDAAQHPRTHPTLVAAAQSSAYVVAPVLRGGEVVAMLHADRLAFRGEVDEADRDLLAAFAEAFGYALDRALLFQQVQGSHSTVDPAVLASLTSRERDVVELLATGASNAAIASRLVISETTAKSHVQHILRKLGASNRAEAVSRYLQAGGRPQRRRPTE